MENEKEFTITILLVIGVILAFSFFISLMNNKNLKKKFETQAIERGYAEYVMTPYGEETFVWKENE